MRLLRYVLAGTAVAWAGVAVVAFVLDAEWLHPAENGPGPFMSARQRWLLAAVCVGAPVAALAATWARAEPVPFRIVLASGALTTLLAVPAWNATGFQHAIGEPGFAEAVLETTYDAPLYLYNGTPTPLTVCLGYNGVCRDGTYGPAVLRGGGVTVPPNRRMHIGKMPHELGSAWITLSGAPAGVANRNAVLAVGAPPPPATP